MNALRSPHRMAVLSVLFSMAVMLAFATGCGTGKDGATSDQQSPGQSTSAYEEADAKALGTLGNRKWYDRAKGEYRPPQTSQEVDHPLRRNGTFAGPNGSKPVPGGGGGGGGGTWRLPSGEVIGYTILITLGTALLAVAIFLIWTSVRTWLPGRGIRELEHKPIAIDPTRVADLPFEAQSEMQDPLAYAKYLIGQGNLDEAVIFIYGYMLLALDRAGKITLHRGKTNRMYLHELADDPQLRSMLTPAMLAFEDVFFGRHSVQPDRFQSIWNQLDEFHRILASSLAPISPLAEGVAP